EWAPKGEDSSKSNQCSCCKNSPPKQPAPAKPQPVKPLNPLKSCCCQAESLIAPLPEPLKQSAALALPLTSTGIGPEQLGSAGNPPPASSLLSPPLQLLHCVWRC